MEKRACLTWIPVTEFLPEEPCLVFDAIGKTLGIWDGYTFDSITGSYSFDAEYSDGMVFFTEGERKICGMITHWYPLPKPPLSKEYKRVGTFIKGLRTR